MNYDQRGQWCMDIVWNVWDLITYWSQCVFIFFNIESDWFIKNVTKHFLRVAITKGLYSHLAVLELQWGIGGQGWVAHVLALMPNSKPWHGHVQFKHLATQRVFKPFPAHTVYWLSGHAKWMECACASSQCIHLPGQNLNFLPLWTLFFRNVNIWRFQIFLHA